MFKRIVNAVLAKVRTIDPKLVAAGVAYLATTAVVKVAGLDLDEVVLPAYPVTWGQAVALAAAGAAGWWKANAASILRSRQESGNPVIPDGVELARPSQLP